MSFSFSFVANEKIFHFTSKLVSVPTSRKYLPRKRTKRKRKHATAFYALASVLQMNVAGRACTLALAIAAKRCTLAALVSFEDFCWAESPTYL